MQELVLFIIANTIFLIKNKKFTRKNYLSYLLGIFTSLLFYNLFVQTQISILFYVSGFQYVSTIALLFFPNWQFSIYLLISDLQINSKLLFLRIVLKDFTDSNNMEKAIVLLNLTDRYKESLGLSNRLLKIKKTNTALSHKLYSLLRLKDYKNANVIVDEILVTNHNNSYYLTVKADILFYLKDYQGAIEYYNQVLNFRSNSPEILYNIGKSLMELERFENCEEYFKKAISLNPLFIPAYTSLAKLYLNQSLKENAIGILEDIKKVVPNMSFELQQEISKLYQKAEQL